MVTHDQEEALSMADRIILMNKGVIEQIGTPHELYSKPNTSFAADFIGKTNLIHASKVSDSKVSMLGKEFECSEPIPQSQVTIAIRPEDIKITQNPNDASTVQGKIIEIEFLGSYSIGQVEVSFDNQKENLICHLPIDNNEASNLAKNSQINLTLSSNSLKIVT